VTLSVKLIAKEKKRQQCKTKRADFKEIRKVWLSFVFIFTLIVSNKLYK
jgi:hypothetical protein